MASHVPDRPTWQCRACPNPWPCETARQHLAAGYEGAPASRHAYLTDMAALAAFDLAGDSAASAQVVDRILAARTDS